MLRLLRLSPAARIVNLFGSLGSLAVNGDPQLGLIFGSADRL